MSVAEQLRKEGERIKQFEIAKNMLQSGMDDSQVIAFTRVTKKDIKQMKKELK